MEATYLQYFSLNEEMAEEFGIYRPMVEKDLNASVGGKNENEKRKEDKDEKKARIQSKPTNSSR